MTTITLDLAAIDTDSLHDMKESIELELYNRQPKRTFNLPIPLTEGMLLKKDLSGHQLVLDPRDQYAQALFEATQDLSTYWIDKVEINPYLDSPFPHYRIHLVNGEGLSVHIPTRVTKPEGEYPHDNLVWVTLENIEVSVVDYRHRDDDDPLDKFLSQDNGHFVTFGFDAEEALRQNHLGAETAHWVKMLSAIRSGDVVAVHHPNLQGDSRPASRTVKEVAFFEPKKGVNAILRLCLVTGIDAQEREITSMVFISLNDDNLPYPDMETIRPHWVNHWSREEHCG